MSYSKLSSITLYVVAAISLIVILFFYVSPRTVDVNEIEARVEQLLTEGVPAETPDTEVPAEADSTAADSLQIAETVETDSTETDSAAIAAAVNEDEDMGTTAVAPGEVDLRDHLSNWEYMVYKRTDYALGWAYILFIIAALAAVLFPLISTVTDVKAILQLLAILGAAAILVVFSYFVLASDTAISIIGYTGTDNTNPKALKWIGTGLYSTYIIFGIALLSILYSEVAKLFK
jgi:hypothetical protein